MSKKVFIYSIPRQTATGVSQFVNDSSGRSLKKVKIGRTRDTLRALYDPKVGGYANYISYTPWLKPDGTPYTDEKGHPLTMQTQMEKKWNLPEGYLTNRAWRKGDSIKDEDFTYYMKTSWKLNDGCTVLDLSNMDEELGYYVMLASSKVANSEKEWLEHKWPKAEYYIALENESEELEYSKNDRKSKAFGSLHLPELTDAVKRKMVSLLGIASSKSELTTQQVHNLLFKFIDSTSFTPGSNLDKYNAILSLFNTPDGREKFEARWILKQAMDTRVVLEKQDTYTWNRPKGPIVIGDRYDEAVEFILDPRKSVDVEEMIEEINKRLK